MGLKKIARCAENNNRRRIGKRPPFQYAIDEGGADTKKGDCVSMEKATEPPLNGLAQILVTEKIADECVVRAALLEAKKNQTPFILPLLNAAKLDAKIVAHTASKNFGVPYIHLEAFDKEAIPKKLVSEKLIRRHHALPLYQRGNHLFLAVADPSQQITLDEIKFHTGLIVHSIVVEADKLQKLIDEVLNNHDDIFLDNLDADLENLSISSDEDDTLSDDGEEKNDAPIIQFVNKILLDAISRGASDIHCEPYENIYRIRFRIDGILIEIANPPVALAHRITSRLKVMSRLDISERRIPQDGRFKMKLSAKRAIDFRISTCPTVTGEKVVMRILDPANAHIGIDALGFNPDQHKLFLENIHQPQGMVLVTGPTGSGKTVTLYTALNLLNSIEKNISTAEDPVEIHVTGINQVDINTKTGLTFAAALRSFLRQDPDIIMVGEMRDLETAEIAVKAAQTGHLVLSTLHTNSAPETLSRLVNMGVPTFNIATSVTLIIAQRLARRLCNQCKVVENLPDDALVNLGFNAKELKKLTLYTHGDGCEQCIDGYKGRVGVYEVLQMTDEIGNIIMSGGNAFDIAKQAKIEGILTLRGSGLAQVKAGVTSLAEINRVTTD